MVTILGRGTPEPAPRLTPQGAGAPQFAVQFSRPRAASRPDSRTNTFRWTGSGTIHILERGLLVLTRRRSPLGFRTADERFVPASEICEVFRDGDSVRVDLRDEARNTAFFQFWTGNPAIAGTIVRLLPTTRTIEYEVAPTEQAATPRPPLTLHRRRTRRRFVQAAVVVGLLAIAALLVTDIVIRQTPPRVVPETVKVDVPESKPVVVTPVPHATATEISSAQAELRKFDDRMDGLRTQYQNASLALQWGQLTRDEFIDGLDKWLIPQWRALDKELAATQPAAGSLAALVHSRLINTAIFWDRGLQRYADGLKTNNYGTVIAAFDWMSNGNESRREAWRIVERAEFESTATASTARKP